ncbi:MAG: DUF262 domain-containing HNH endonuclease family protein [Syntrophomonadaceae bacterium]|nr:DUF262 domain-containing HNH endonuclease family protein [Syntrophomonadaceae bacterium]
MPIRPEYLTLDDLMQKRLFRIPNYQRSYSWETKQRKDLFKDIEKLMNNRNQTRTHFMSMVVCLHTNEGTEIGTDKYTYVDIVDGQQRLTTLIILLKALEKVLVSGSKIEKSEALKLRRLLVKDNKELILLQTNHDSSSTFRNYIINGLIVNNDQIKTTADRNLVDAFSECQSFVENWNKNYQLLDLLKLLKHRLDFVFYTLEDEGSVYSVFEVLNSRGLDVDWLDKCKSGLMGIVFEKGIGQSQIDELHKIWSNIYRIIGIKTIPGHEILRFAATLMQDVIQSRPLGAEDAMDYFLTECRRKPSSAIQLSEWILAITLKLNSLYENKRLEAVTDIVQARLLAVAIFLAEQLSDQQRTKALEEWEIVTFRIFGMFRKDARTKVGDYTRLARSIMKDKIRFKMIMTELIELGADYPIEEAVKNLANIDCYNGWEKDLRYFMYRYEESNYENTISQDSWNIIWTHSPSTTIEHICPQAAKNNDLLGWRNKMGRSPEIVQHNINRLGNLLILPPSLNSKLSKKAFEEKKKIYKKNLTLNIVQEITSEPDWNQKRMIEREKKLLTWAEQAWADINS